MTDIIFKNKNPTLDCIVDNILYLGELDCIENIDIEIDGIVNVTPEKIDTTLPNLQIPINDSPSEPIEDYYVSFFNFCREKRILIVCHNSVSRSVTFTILWLMFFMNMNCQDALEYVSSKRTQYTAPKFINKLRKFNKNDYVL